MHGQQEKPDGSQADEECTHHHHSAIGAALKQLTSPKHPIWVGFIILTLYLLLQPAVYDNGLVGKDLIVGVVVAVAGALVPVISKSIWPEKPK